MKTASLICGAFLASAAIAQPRHRHQHAARHEIHEKREQSVVWVTNWDYVTEIIPLTTTIWVTPGFVPPSPSTSSPASSSASGGLFFETAIPEAATSQATSSSVYVAPTPTSTFITPSSEAASTETPTPASTSLYVAPVESSTAAQATTTQAPVNTPISTSAAAPAPVTTSASSTSSSGDCSSGSPCSGDITYYDTGLGACGWTNDGTETVVALSHLLMGAQSNGNPYCGKYITIQHGGKTVTAKVVDKCMSCSMYSIDLSDAAFSSLDDMAAGRTQATWFFN